MKSGLVGKHDICQKVGVSADSVRHVTGKIVSPWGVLWFQLLQNLHLVRIDITAFGEPYAELIVASAVPVKPDELTSLDFG
jgi:hypothetical protein